VKAALGEHTGGCRQDQLAGLLAPFGLTQSLAFHTLM
jgi:hypothetical protein